MLDTSFFILAAMAIIGLIKASVYVDQGFHDMMDNHYNVGGTGSGVNRTVSMGASNFGALATTTTSIAAATFSQVNLFDSNPTRSGLTTTFICTFTDAQITGQQLTTFTVHNDGAGVDTGVQFGVDGQDLTYSGVDVTVEMDVTGASA